MTEMFSLRTDDPKEGSGAIVIPELLAVAAAVLVWWWS